MRFAGRNKMLGSIESSNSSSWMRFRPFSVLIAILQRHLPWERSQSTQPQQVVGGADEVRVQLHSGDAAEARAAQATPALHPAENLFDPLALSLADPVARMPSRASIQPRGVAPLDLGDVRANAAAAQKLHKRLAVIALVGTETLRLLVLAALALEQLGRRSGLARERRAHADVHAQPVAVLHERMSAKAELRFFALALARRLRLRITGGRIRVVRALGAAEIHSAPAIGQRWPAVFRLEALLSRPRLDQRAVHGQMFRGEQPLLTSDLHDGIEETLRQILVHQPLA